MKRRIGYTILVILFLGVAATVYINTIFLPIQFKQIIIEKTRQFLTRDVTIGKITCGPIQGVNVYDINIYKKDTSGEPFISVKKLSFTLLLPPIFKNQTLLIPSITVTDPNVFINRKDDNQFNFSDIIKKVEKKKARRIIVGGLNVDNGTLYYDDLRLKKDAREILENFQFKSNITLKKTVKFESSFGVRDTASQFSADGEFKILDKKVSLRLIPQKVDLERFLKFIRQKPQFEILSGELDSGEIDLNWQKNLLTITGLYNISKLAGTISFDKALKANFIRAETELNFSPEKKEIKGKVQIRDARFQTEAGNEFSGNIRTDSFKWTLDKSINQAAGDFNIKNAHLEFSKNRIYKGNITTKGTLITVENGVTNIQTALQIDNVDFQFDENVRLLGIITSSESSASIKEGIVNYSGLIKLNNGQLSLPKDVSLLADPDITFSLKYSPYSEDQINYNGSVQLDKASLVNIPLFEKISDITGRVNFSTDKVETEALQLLSPDAGIILKGHLKNFKNPILDITYASPGISLDKVGAMFQKYLDMIQSTVSGRAKIKGRYRGPLAKPQEAVINISAFLENSTFESKNFPNKISQLFGEIQYEYDLIKLINLKGTYQEQNYLVNAALSDFSRPKVTATIASKNLNVNSDINILNNVLQIKSLRGFYHHTALDIVTDVHFNKGDSTYLNLRGDVKLNLDDLPYFAPKYKGVFSRVKPNGIVHTEIFFKGFVDQWEDWQMVLKGKSPRIRFSGLGLEQFYLEYEQRDKNINLFNINANMYTGTISLKSSADLTKDEKPFQLVTNVKDVDLNLLKEDTKLAKRDLSGKFEGRVDLQGGLKNVKKSASGSASFALAEGEILQFKFLNNFWETIGLPQFGNVKFTDAYGDFNIDNQRLQTENLTLDSRQMRLDAAGWMDFDQNIDFKVKTKSNEAYIANNKNIAQAPLKYLAKTVTLLDFHVGGTLFEPKMIKVSPHLPDIKVLDKTKDVLIDGMRNIVEGFF